MSYLEPEGHTFTCLRCDHAILCDHGMYYHDCDRELCEECEEKKLMMISNKLTTKTPTTAKSPSKKK